MKLALYGGSFDPPHAGHVAIVREALRVLPIDRLIVVPASRNPFKNSVVAEGKVRYEWLKEIFKSDDQVSVSDFEITHERSVYTIETVQHYAPQCDELFVIIGADNLEKLSTWHRFAELNALVRWVVATREGISIPDNMIRLEIDVPIRSTDFRSAFGSLGLESNIESKIITYYKEHQ